MTNKICAKIQEGRKTTYKRKTGEGVSQVVSCGDDLVEAGSVGVWWQYGWYWPDMMSGHGRRLSWSAGAPLGWSPLSLPDTTELT